MTTEVRALGPEDWRELRDVRLRALAESPAAFGSNLAREQAFDDTTWRERTSGAVVAYVDGVPVALGGGVDEGDDGTCSVVAMWTDPARRGRGLGGRVLEEVVAAARARGRVARLFVMLANPDVARLYERHGFVRTGLVEVHGGREAEEMRVPLPS